MSKSTRFIYIRTISKLENRVAHRWVSGVGKEAVFEDHTVGWYAHFAEDPTALYLGTTETGLKVGDKLRLVAERV